MAQAKPSPRERQDPELNPTAASLLGFLHQGPRAGWDLLRLVQGSIGYFWNVTQSHLYRELRSLEARGLVEAGPSGPRDKQPFVLTDVGRSVFAQWIAKEPGQELIRFPLLVTLFFGGHLPEGELEAFLAEHRARHEARLAEYRQIEENWDAGDRFMLATLRFGLEYEQAVLRWFDARPWATQPGRRPPS
jgi:DNA-binding PadR family transcriptional regulator